MNQEELGANPTLTDWVVQDLNADPALPFSDETFDVVLNVVSVEYLTRPFEVFEEVGRVLKPGGLFLVVFSTRWFPPKVVRAWEDAKEEERIGIVEEFFRKAEVFGPSELFVSMGLPRPEDDRYFSLGIPSDPVFAVFAEKVGAPEGRQPRLVLRDPAQIDLDWAKVQARKGRWGRPWNAPIARRGSASGRYRTIPASTGPTTTSTSASTISAPSWFEGGGTCGSRGSLEPATVTSSIR